METTPAKRAPGADGEVGPSEADLAPYLGRRPLVRVLQLGDPEEGGTLPSYDLVVFDDGRVFFEGESCVAALGLRGLVLAPEELASLRRELGESCPLLTRSDDRRCSHASSSVTVECHVGSRNDVGEALCSGGLGIAEQVVDMARARPWIGHLTNPRCSTELGNHAGRIATMLSPPRPR